MRLIDADELIKQFHYGGIADTEEDKAWTATVRRTIKAQPTAYDIDDVVEQLNATFDSWGLDEGKKEIMREIVKGGVE